MQSPQTNIPDKGAYVAKVCLLDEKLAELYEAMPYDMQQPQGHLSHLLPFGESGSFSLAYLYHTSVCYLHSSIVPALSGKTNLPYISRKMKRKAVTQVLRHSKIMTDMTATFMSQTVDLSKLWPIVGYGAHLCATIQMRCYTCIKNPSIFPVEPIRVHLRLCDELTRHWAPLQEMVLLPFLLR